MGDEAIGFEWDSSNLAHISRHRVVPREAEEVIVNDPLDIGSETIEGEERLVSVGRTNRGRILVVVTTMRGERIRVVTAFPAAKRLCDIYVQQKGS